MKNKKTCTILLAMGLLLSTPVYAEIQNVIISPSAIGPFKVGQKIPREWRAKGKRYRGYYADGVLLKGWSFNDGHIIVGTHLNKVETVIVNCPSVKTSDGVGIGTSFAKLKKLYTVTRDACIPEIFGGDTRVVTVKELPDIFFYFKDCQRKRPSDKITHITMSKNTQNDI